MTDFFALNDVIHVHTIRHINDDVALCAMPAKTETIGAGVEKVKILVNSDNMPCDLTKKMNTHTLSTNKTVTDDLNSEVGSRKSMEKAEDIQFHP